MFNSQKNNETKYFFCNCSYFFLATIIVLLRHGNDKNNTEIVNIVSKAVFSAFLPMPSNIMKNK